MGIRITRGLIQESRPDGLTLLQCQLPERPALLIVQHSSMIAIAEGVERSGQALGERPLGPVIGGDRFVLGPFGPDSSAPLR